MSKGCARIHNIGLRNKAKELTHPHSKTYISIHNEVSDLGEELDADDEVLG